MPPQLRTPDGSYEDWDRATCTNCGSLSHSFVCGDCLIENLDVTPEFPIPEVIETAYHTTNQTKQGDELTLDIILRVVALMLLLAWAMVVCIGLGSAFGQAF